MVGAVAPAHTEDIIDQILYLDQCDSNTSRPLPRLFYPCGLFYTSVSDVMRYILPSGLSALLFTSYDSRHLIVLHHRGFNRIDLPPLC